MLKFLQLGAWSHERHFRLNSPLGLSAMNSPGSMEALSRWVEEIKHFEETLPSACFTFINMCL